MKILVTNDDGIAAEGLWALVKELKNISDVIVVAPDNERSGIGTAITFKQPLHVKEVSPEVPGVRAFSVTGTPADSVILALEQLVKDEISMVISGINHGPNLGYDVLVSGTVGAALQGYLRGLPVISLSVFYNKLNLDNAAKVAVSLVERLNGKSSLSSFFLNVNLPDRPLADINGVKITRLLDIGHIGTVKEESKGNTNRFRLIPKALDSGEDEMTDVWAISQGNISITPLHDYLGNGTSPGIDYFTYSNILDDLQKRI